MIRKSIFSAAFAVTALALALTGCKGDDPQPDNPDNPGGGAPSVQITQEEIDAAVQVPINMFIYYGDDHFVGGENFYVEMADPGVTANMMDTTGTGHLVALEFNLNPSDVENIFPKEGIYDIKPGFGPGHVVGGYLFDQGAMFGMPPGMFMLPLGCYSIQVKDGASIGGTKLAASGHVKVNGTPDDMKMLLVYEYADGTSKSFYAAQKKLKVSDNATKYDLSWEKDSLKGDKDIIMDKADFIDQGTANLPYLRTCAIYLSCDTTYGAILEVNIPAEAEALTPGTYPISKIREANTMLASRGADTFNDYPSYLYGDIKRDKDGNLGYNACWYLQEGTLVVKSDGIEVNAKSALGSQIKITYTGDITLKKPETPSMSAPRLRAAGR